MAESEDSRVSRAEAARNPQRIRVLLAEDHPQVLEAVRQLLAGDFDVVDAVQDGKSLIRAAAEKRPDAVISDIEMPEVNGVEAGRAIVAQGHSKGVVVLTMHNERDLLARVMEAGIRGFVLKVDAADELPAAVRSVVVGQVYISRHARLSGHRGH